MICLLESSFGGKPVIGTGWFINPDVIITVAHNLRKGKGAKGKWASQIDIKHDNATITSKEFLAPPSFVNHRHSTADYGAIFLNERVSPTFFGIEEFTKDNFETERINFAGYGNGVYSGSSGWVKTVDQILVRHTLGGVAGADGSSGAPIWFFDGDNRRVVAMHLGILDLQSSGLRIMQSIYDDLVDLKFKQNLNKFSTN